MQKYLLDNLGLNFAGSQKHDLLKRIEHAAGKFNFRNANTFIEWILSNNLTDADLEKLASFLTIGETYFLREPKAYNYLQFSFLPELIKKQNNRSKKIRIWSAGCATGEEVYSLAIILTQVLVDYQNWDIQIIGTDINPNFLQKAEKGEYTKWSFRSCPENFITNYFDKTRQIYKIKDRYRELVTFQSVNLMKSEYGKLLPEGEFFDVIFCRNVMIYFSQDNIDKVAEKFYSVLDAEGILLTGLVEMSALNDSAFGRIIEDGLTIFIKDKKAKKSHPVATPKIFSRDWLENSIEMRANTMKRNIAFTQIRNAIPKPNISHHQKMSINPDIQSQKLYEQALEFYDKGEFEQAKKLLRTIRSEHEYQEADVTYLLIKSEANVGNYEIALKLCDQAIIGHNLSCRLYYLYANICLELQMYDEALKNLRKAIYLKPDFVLAHYLMGKLQEKKGSADADRKQKKIITDILGNFEDDYILLESEGLTIHEFKKMINV
ncbi:MAG TPA: CheR family methyltransferase [Candidatus Cloacimonadota bacterium]|nr:CheR family methyltransferase [Candidatus Cloacimonadota bacterium]